MNRPSGSPDPAATLRALVTTWRRQSDYLKLEAAEWESHMERYARYFEQGKLAATHADELEAALAAPAREKETTE